MMIWDKFAPFYDFMDTVYNGKCYKGIAELKRVCKPKGKIILPVYINKEKKNSIVAAKLLSAFGVKFKRQFSLESYKEFIASHDIPQVTYSVVDGRMPCAFAVITNS